MSMQKKSVLVCGGGGFIGGHLVNRLRADGYWVRAVDLKFPEFLATEADDFMLGDLRNPDFVARAIDRRFDAVYQLAADMGGAGYVFTGENDADILHNSALINLNVLEACRQRAIRKIFYSSSACIYPAENQTDPLNPLCREDSAYPANPDSDYGWEKLFSERLYLAYARNHGMACCIGRYHNVFGPYGTWTGGREKAPAAICRKVAEASSGGMIEIWGDGQQTRSFLYIEECVEATLRLMHAGYGKPINIGSDQMISINDLAQKVIGISGKSLALRHVPGPLGVRGRNSDNDLIKHVLEWAPSRAIEDGLKPTYAWITAQAFPASKIAA